MGVLEIHPAGSNTLQEGVGIYFFDMRFDIITIFPKIFDSYFGESILKRAREKNLANIKIHNLRDFSGDKHQKVDDKPFGGGAGMVLRAEPMLRAVSALKTKNQKPLPAQAGKTKIIILSAKGKQFTQKMAYVWARKFKHLILISGRYEGIDERVRFALKAEEISIGPYVLTDGDVAAMVLISAVTRLLPGVIKKKSLEEESFGNWKLEIENSAKQEYPQYTRPEIFLYKGKKYRVPKILLSGDHKKIAAWRKKHQR